MATATSRATGPRPGAEDIFVEITDPQTGKTFFANIATGECCWERPRHGRVKPKDESGIEWWELYDDNHKLPYYYNTKTGETEWLRPNVGTVIPLTAIQNSSIGKRVSVLVQQASSVAFSSSLAANSHLGGQSLAAGNAFGASFANHASPLYSTTISERVTQDSGPNYTAHSPGRSNSVQSESSNPSYSPSTPTKVRQSNSIRKLSPSPPTSSSPSRNSLTNSMKDLRETAARARAFGISDPVLNQDAAAAMSPLNSSGKQQQPQQPQQSQQSQPAQQRGSANPLASPPSSELKVLPKDLKAQLSQFQIEGFASKYFSEHKRGIFFRRKVPVEKMLLYQKEPLRTPLMVLSKNLQKDALRCFKLIQKIMKNEPASVLQDTQTLLERGILHGGLRDEIYVQICKQLTNNPDPESVYRGWILIAVVTIAFPPSKNFEEYLKTFVQQHQSTTTGKVSQVIRHCMKKLTRVCKTGPRGKVPSVLEIQRAQEAPFTPSLFGEPLDDIMRAELEKNPHAVVPRVLPFLADAIIELNGQKTEGIFRVPGDADAVTELRMRVEKGDYNLSGITDPNVPSSLLKFWLRDLADPLIPSEFYDRCIQVGQAESKNNSSESTGGTSASDIIAKLPDVNQRVVNYVIKFLRKIAEPQNQPFTKMTTSNVAMVFAPNFLRCPSDNPTVIFESTK
ncbi:hypothetical protein DFS34DRAFT_281217 [Phlyctochytrium arcticum]|nr:hypothetical protein DFS34DRAFT_281217 [Phlyctochytrium arcticum]